MLILIIILAHGGIPDAGLALIYAIDRPFDMCRTTVNITEDAAVSNLLAKSVNKLGPPIVKDWDGNYKKTEEKEMA